MARIPALLLTIATVFILSSCATNRTVDNPRDKEAVAAAMYEKKSEFGEHYVLGPVIEGNFNGLLYSDIVSVQLMKTEKNRYYLRVHNWHSGNGWKFIESVTTLDGKTIRLADLNRDVGGCSGLSCTYTEIGYAPLSKSQHLNGNNDLKVRINAKKWGTQVMLVPKQYIQAFIERAG